MKDACKWKNPLLLNFKKIMNPAFWPWLSLVAPAPARSEVTDPGAHSCTATILFSNRRNFINWYEVYRYR